MERKIVFRGKNRYRKEWLYGNLVQYKDGSFGIDGVPVETDSVGQFTGLYDTNKKPIYEGDIVRYYDDIEDELVTAEVIYHADSCSFCARLKYSEPIGLFAHWQYEIIGNRFDNPELISKKQ